MQRIGIDSAKTLALFIVLLVAQVAAGAAIYHNAGPALHNAGAVVRDGPLDNGQALLVANAADAIILALLASSMRARGFRLGLLLAGVLFMVQTGLLMMETAFFNRDIGMTNAGMVDAIALGLVRDALAGAAIALLWRGPSEPALKLGGLLWKAPVIGAFYVLVYFVAGFVFVLSHAEARAYYAHVAGGVDLKVFLPFQFGRGLIWCAVAWLMVRTLNGPAWRAALLVGLALAGLIIPLLLFPNSIMPWPVRAAHIQEIGVSMSLFGAIITLLMRMGGEDSQLGAGLGRKPLSA